MQPLRITELLNRSCPRTRGEANQQGDGEHPHQVQRFDPQANHLYNRTMSIPCVCLFAAATIDQLLLTLCVRLCFSNYQ